ncbi:hypothetical protein C8R44DRAFT_736089 [Mycena epipterygia]|nr:hypothetical protein C8R44DRAFT_736089 [Mycena epipterygia]
MFTDKQSRGQGGKNRDPGLSHLDYYGSGLRGFLEQQHMPSRRETENTLAAIVIGGRDSRAVCTASSECTGGEERRDTPVAADHSGIHAVPRALCARRKKSGVPEQGYAYGLLPLALAHGAGYASRLQNSEVGETSEVLQADGSQLLWHSKSVHYRSGKNCFGAAKGTLGTCLAQTLAPNEAPCEAVKHERDKMSTSGTKNAGPSASSEIRAAAGAVRALRETGESGSAFPSGHRITYSHGRKGPHLADGMWSGPLSVVRCSVRRGLGEDGSVAGVILLERTHCFTKTKAEVGTGQGILGLIVNRRDAKNAGFESKDEIGAPLISVRRAQALEQSQTCAGRAEKIDKWEEMRERLHLEILVGRDEKGSRKLQFVARSSGKKSSETHHSTSPVSSSTRLQVVGAGEGCKKKRFVQLQFDSKFAREVGRLNAIYLMTFIMASGNLFKSKKS